MKTPGCTPGGPPPRPEEWRRSRAGPQSASAPQCLRGRRARAGNQPLWGVKIRLENSVGRCRFRFGAQPRAAHVAADVLLRESAAGGGQNVLDLHRRSAAAGVALAGDTCARGGAANDSRVLRASVDGMTSSAFWKVSGLSWDAAASLQASSASSPSLSSPSLRRLCHPCQLCQHLRRHQHRHRPRRPPPRLRRLLPHPLLSRQRHHQRRASHQGVLEPALGLSDSAVPASPSFDFSSACANATRAPCGLRKASHSSSVRSVALTYVALRAAGSTQKKKPPHQPPPPGRPTLLPVCHDEAARAAAAAPLSRGPAPVGADTCA